VAGFTDLHPLIQDDILGQGRTGQQQDGYRLEGGHLAAGKEQRHDEPDDR
jgi:hypothetical protein